MAVSKPDLSLIIKIDGEEHRLDVVPVASSKVVAAEKEKLLGAVDLKTLVGDLGRVAAFIRIAYNGVGAAGPKFTDIQIEIQRLGYDITKLCDQSALTVSKFKKASATILTDLQATYEYLLDNLEELALETLAAVSSIAGDMEKAAMELHQEFKKEEEKVEEALENTQRAKGEEAQRILDKKRERQQLEVQQTEQQKLMEEAQQLEREAQEERVSNELKENNAIKSMNDPLKKLLNAVTSTVGIQIHDEQAAEKQASHWKEKRIEALKKENEFRKQRKEALSKMTTFAAKIKDCQTEQNMAETATDALHQAIKALKGLSAVMLQAVQFWKQMQDHCKSLAEDKMKSTVESAMKYPEDKRRKVWTSTAFKRKAVQFYAGWVALNSVCAEYVEHIKVTQKDLYEQLRENPTYEESRKNLKALAENFIADLKKDQKAIADKESRAQQEIKDLGKGKGNEN